MDIGKIPPSDVEAEQAILGSMLTDKDSVMSAIEVLKSDDFYREDNKAIYEAICNLYSRSEPIDIITVKSELVANGKFESVGGLEYLAILPDKVPTTANVEQYIKIVEEKSLLRNLIRTANEIITLGYSQTEEVEDIMDMAERKIFDLLKERSKTTYTPIKDVYDLYQKVHTKKPKAENPGSMRSSSQEGEKTFISEAEYDKMTDEEIEKNMDLIRKSMYKW